MWKLINACNSPVIQELSLYLLERPFYLFFLISHYYFADSKQMQLAIPLLEIGRGKQVKEIVSIQKQPKFLLDNIVSEKIYQKGEK